MRKLILYAILTFLFCNNYAQEIAQWRGSNRDGKYIETGLLKKWPDAGPVLLWHYDTLGAGYASAAVTKQAVYTSGSIDKKDFIFALDHTGKLIWKTQVGESWTENFDGTRSTPLIYGDKLYYLSPFAKLTCIQTSNGSILWTADLKVDFAAEKIIWGITENLLIDDNKLIVTPGGLDVTMVAYNPENGQLIWKCKGNGEKSAYCSPIVVKSSNGRKIIVTQTQKSIIGIDALTGILLWSHEQTNQWSVHANSPTYLDGFIYCVSGYGKGGVQLKLSDDGAAVTQVWRNESLDYRMGGVVLHNGVIYGADDNKALWFGIDWKTGTQLFESPILAKGDIIFADDLLYIYSDKGEVALVEPNSNGMTLISKFQITLGDKQHWAHPVISNKKLYIRHGNSMMVFDISSKK